MFARLTPRQVTAIDRLSLFIITLYAKYFLQASIPVISPQNDLNFFNDLLMFKNVEEEVAKASLISVKRHLWYLMPEHVMLSLFDNSLSNDDKQLLAVSLLSFASPDRYSAGKPNVDGVLDILQAHEKPPPLSVFVNSNSWFLFGKCL